MSKNKTKSADLLEEYRIFLESLIKTEDSSIFTNADVNHASVLMSVLFDNTQDEIRMYCRGLNPTLTKLPNYLKSFKGYISKKKSFKLLVEHTNYIKEPAFNYIIEESKNRKDNTIQYKQIQEADKTKIWEELSINECNFSVFDDNKFRIEINPNKYEAFGSFNNKEISDKLINLFDEAFDSASNIDSDSESNTIASV